MKNVIPYQVFCLSKSFNALNHKTDAQHGTKSISIKLSMSFKLTKLISIKSSTL